MMKPTYYLAFDGLADWEAALALAEIHKARQNVVTVSFTSSAVTTMGGVRVLPDITLEQAAAKISAESAAMLILPGGEMWERGEYTEISALLRRCETAAVPVAAICGATLAVAWAGLTRGRAHTSNGAEYLQHLIPSYQDAASYRTELAVRDGGLITASGVGSVEFAREILATLGVYDPPTLAQWFSLFKHGVIAES